MDACLKRIFRVTDRVKAQLAVDFYLLCNPNYRVVVPVDDYLVSVVQEISEGVYDSLMFTGNHPCKRKAKEVVWVFLIQVACTSGKLAQTVHSSGEGIEDLRVDANLIHEERVLAIDA